MVEPLKFHESLPGKTGGRDAIMAAARSFIEIAKGEGVAPKNKRAAEKQAVEVLLRAIAEQLREPLIHIFEEHISAIEDEQDLMLGECPKEPGPAQDEWWIDTHNATMESLAGDTIETLGKDAVYAWVTSGEPTEVLVDKLLAVPWDDKMGALEKCGVTKDDVQSIAKLLLGAEEDGPPAPAMTAAEAQDFHEGKSPRKRAPSAESGAVTDASAALLMMLVEGVATKEAAIAEALGVSRPQVNNYKNGKTLWAPTDEQIDALRKLVEDATQRLAAAFDALELARME